MKWFTQALDLNPNSGLEQFIHFLAKANLYFSIEAVSKVNSSNYNSRKTLIILIKML